MTIAYFEISKTSAVTLVNVETAFACFPPVNRFQTYPDQQIGLSGLVVARGLPIDTWDWGFLPEASYDLMRTFCPYASVAVWVRTRYKTGAITSSDQYAYYTGIFNMPEYKTFQVKQSLVYPFSITLTNLVAYTPPT